MSMPPPRVIAFRPEAGYSQNEAEAILILPFASGVGISNVAKAYGIIDLYLRRLSVLEGLGRDQETNSAVQGEGQREVSVGHLQDCKRDMEGG